MLLFFLLLAVRISAQITASPSFTGCAPFSVVLSGPAGATQPYWNFGSSVGTSTLATTNPIFPNPGTYPISYTAIIGGNPVTFTAQIVVNPKPTGSFNFQIPSGSHCAPMTVSLSANVSPGNTYQWDFGDLGPLGSGTSTTHVYQSGNIYTPVLIVTNAASGCTTAIVSGTIPVSNTPTMNIASSNNFSGCAPPFITNIDGSACYSGSPLGGALTYNWQFNNGNPSSSSSAIPGTVSFSAGQNTITLTVTDNNQCTGTTSSLVTVSAPYITALFPGTVCIGSPVPSTITTNQTSATVAVLSTTINTVVSVPNQVVVIDTTFFLFTPGLNTVVVTVQPPNCQSFSVSQVIFVEQVTASFSWAPPYATCQSTMSNTYTNLSVTNCSTCSLSFTWQATFNGGALDWGVPASSVITSMAAPTFTFKQGSVNPYTMYENFTPDITLFVMSNSSAHCSTHFIAAPYTIMRPSASFIPDKKQGCAPLEVSYINNSTNLYLFPISTYTWYSGTTPAITSTGNAGIPPQPIPAFNFTFTNPGVYYPHLTIQTAGGCTDVSFVDTITVVGPPTVSATFPSQVCAGTPVTINMTGSYFPGVPTSTLIDHWHASTDDGYFSGCTTNASPTFSFTHLGTQSVVVTAYQAHCSASATMAPTIQVKGPVGKFRCETTCTGNKKAVKFNVHLQEANTATLYFGEGSSQTVITGNLNGSSSTTVTYTYSATGDYTPRLYSFATNGCPTYSFQQVLKIRDTKAKITFNGLPLPSPPQAAACTKARYRFSGTASTDNYVDCGSYFTWYFQSPTYTLAPLVGPKSKFMNDSIIIGPPADTLYNRLVDGFALDTFRYAGTYTIGLAVKDINGCMDSTWRPFRVSDAKPVFSVPVPLCYSDGTFQINNTTQNSHASTDVISSYTFDFGDQTAIQTSTNSFYNPSHFYNPVSSPSQTFNIMCIAQSALGCKDTTILNVQVNNPEASFHCLNPFPCLPFGQPPPVGFDATQGFATYSVNYGDPLSQPPWISSSSFSNVSHAYNTPGIYQPTLIVTDQAGCSLTETTIVTAIGQPTAHISLPNGINGFCRPAQPILTSLSSIYMDSIYNYIWSIGSISSFPPGSPTLQTNFVAPVTTVSLTVSMTNYQLCPSTTTVQIFTYDPKAHAVINPTVICLGANLNASVVIEQEVAQWQWFFGDFVPQPIYLNGPFTPTAIAYPYNIYPTAGQDGKTTVTLSYSATTIANNNCHFTDDIQIRIVDVKSDFKQVEDIYAHCVNISDTFTSTAINAADLNLSYVWDFGDLAGGVGLSPSHTYTQAGVYNVSLTINDGEHSCGESSVKQMTIFPLPSATLSAKPLVCPNVPFEIEGNATPGLSGIVTGTLDPAINQTTLNFGATNSFTVNGIISQNSDLKLLVTDDNGCKNSSAPFHVLVQDPVPHIEWDTTVIIGQPIPLNAYVGPGFSYTWTPTTNYLNCDTCQFYNPVSTSTVNITYSVSVEDGLHCSVVSNLYRIHIELKASLDVPTAFTPNGDGVNDNIFAAGWALKKLNYFRVFNRWGQLVFETNELGLGWDGMFRGVPQNMDTYVYQVSAQTLVESEPVITKTGTFKLLR